MAKRNEQQANTQAQQTTEQTNQQEQQQEQQVAVGFEAELAKLDKLMADESLALLHVSLATVRNSMIRERIRTIQKEVAMLRKMLPQREKREKKA